MGELMEQLPKEALDDKELVKIEAMIQSMTKQERNHPDILDESRMLRVAKGSGRPFEEVAGVRKIWGREFELQRCEKTKKFLPITKDQAAFLAKRQNMNPSYLSKSAAAQRTDTAETFGKIARWNKMGMTLPQEVK